MRMDKGRAWRIVVALCLLTGTGVAGFKQSNAIAVHLTPASQGNYNNGSGSLGTGHSSSTSTYVGCQVVGEQGKSAVASCGAKDSGGDSMSCTANGSRYRDNTRWLSGESYLSITDFGRDGTCEYLTTEVDSSLATKSASGNSANTTVSINDNSTFAKGSIGTVHRSADNTQHIGCSIKGTSNFFTGVRSNSVSCSAKDNGNPTKSLSCSSTTLSIIEAAMSIKDDSYLEITRSGSTCTKLLVKNDSRYDSHQGARR